MPYDVTGKYERVPLENVKAVVDNCILYTNENENGLTIDSHQQLPLVVADFLYNYVFLEQNDNTGEFIRTYSLEILRTGEMNLMKRLKMG